VAVFVSTTKADTAPEIPLPQLATSRFVELSLAEEKLVNAAANGTAADCSELSGEHRKIRGKLFSWLCTDRDASAQVTYRGISVVGAEIEGLVDLQWAKLSSPLLAQRCAFDALIILEGSHLVSLNLAASSIRGMRAENLIIERGVILVTASNLREE